jgi:hypothetical protein
MSLGGLKQFWEDVRAGRRPRPTRTSDRRTHKLRVQLDGTFGSDRGRRINLVIYSNGVIELRLSKSPRKEVIHAVDVYRYAVRCRVNRVLLEKARLKKAKKDQRRAQARQERAERRLIYREEKS